MPVILGVLGPGLVTMVSMVVEGGRHCAALCVHENHGNMCLQSTCAILMTGLCWDVTGEAPIKITALLRSSKIKWLEIPKRCRFT
ncbi:unnamed protein product [Camellia sinensis]